MWNDLSEIWKQALSMAYEAYMRGTIPIGAVLVDHEQNIVATGRNRIFDKTSSHPLAGTDMAHAEMTAMYGLTIAGHPHIRRYTLYSTMEPCPMCFGTMTMLGIRNLEYATRDRIAGAACLCETMPYIKNKKQQVRRGPEEMEVFSIAIQTVFTLESKHPRPDYILNAWDMDCSSGVCLGRKLYEQDYFKTAVRNKLELGFVYDQVQQLHEELSKQP